MSAAVYRGGTEWQKGSLRRAEHDGGHRYQRLKEIAVFAVVTAAKYRPSEVGDEGDQQQPRS